jgi:hypothetical protein
MISSSGHHHFVVRHFNGLGGFGFGFGFRPDGIRIGRVVITVQEADGRQAVDAEVLIQQMPPADVVGALQTLVRCIPAADGTAGGKRIGSCYNWPTGMSCNGIFSRNSTVPRCGSAVLNELKR